MKKGILLLFIIFICLNVGACNAPSATPNEHSKEPSLQINTATGTVSGNYIYQAVNIDDQHQIILKYHLLTGEVTPLCQDPYCNHEQASCPFYLETSKGVDVVYIGDTVFFNKYDSNGNNLIIAYDNALMHSEIIYDDTYQIIGPFPYQYHLYYTVIINKIPTLFRYDTQSQQTELVMTYEAGYLFDIKNDWIYIALGKDNYIIYDLSGNLLSNAVPGDYRGYTYKLDEVQSTMGMRDATMSYFRAPVGTTTWEKIAENIGPVENINNLCVYFIPLKLEDQELIYSNETEKIYNIFGGNVYLMNLDGSEAKLLCCASGCDIKGLSGYKNNKLTSGDWLGIKISKYVSDSSGNIIMRNTDLLLVNLATGEYHEARYTTNEDVIDEELASH